MPDSEFKPGRTFKIVQAPPGSGTGAPDERPPDVQLAVMVPPHARDDVRRRAFEESTTVRSIVLRALVACGVTRLDERDLMDRRLPASSPKTSA